MVLGFPLFAGLAYHSLNIKRILPFKEANPRRVSMMRKIKATLPFITLQLLFSIFRDVTTKM
jgi:hypothetical protein